MSAKAVEAKIKNAPEMKVIGIDMAEASRRAWLVGLGVVAMAQDEIVHFANRLVERGAITEKEARKLVEKARARAMQWQRDGLKSAETELDHQVDAVLDWLGVPTKTDIERMNLPSRADIEALSEKVAALTRKVEQLRKLEEQQAHEITAVRKTEEKQNRKIEQVRKTAEEKPAEPVKA